MDVLCHEKFVIFFFSLWAVQRVYCDSPRGFFCASELLMAALRLLLLARRWGRQCNPYIERLDRSLLVL